MGRIGEPPETGIPMSRSRTWSLIAVLALGAVVTMVGAIRDAPVLGPVPGPGEASLLDGERAYLNFMVPRLDRLIQEGTAVSTLVNERSRDVLSLSRHGNRISALTSDILEWDSANAVPARFLSAHASLVASAEELETLIEEARRTLLTFDFSEMSMLVPRFDDATATMRTVRETLPVPDYRVS